MVLALAIGALILTPGPSASRSAIAGGLAALSLAVGLEMIFFIALAGLLLTVEVLFTPTASARRLLGFGVGLGVAAPLLYVAQYGSGSWANRSCDQLSVPVLLLTSSAAVYTIALAVTHQAFPRIPRRVGAGSLLTLIFLAAAYRAFGPCIAGPYADLAEDIQKIVIGGIIEAAPAWKLLSLAPVFALNALLPLCLVFGLLVAQLARGNRAQAASFDRRPLFILLAFVCLGLLGAFWQLRAFLWGLAVLPLAFGATMAYWTDAQGSRRPLAKLFVLAALFVGIVTPQTLTLTGQKLFSSGLGSQQNTASALSKISRNCGSHAQISRLNQIPVNLILAPINLGPRILLHTPHAVISAPYHRSAAALSNGVFPFIGGFEDMAQKVQQSEAGLVVVCNLQRSGQEESAGARLASGDFPNWLRPIEVGASDLTVLRVLRDAQGNLLREPKAGG
ncbi:MAG: hypothetical protein JXR14_15790 [Paracoccaceae bacterium]